MATGHSAGEGGRDSGLCEPRSSGGVWREPSTVVQPRETDDSGLGPELAAVRVGNARYSPAGAHSEGSLSTAPSFLIPAGNTGLSPHGALAPWRMRVGVGACSPVVRPRLLLRASLLALLPSAPGTGLRQSDPVKACCGGTQGLDRIPPSPQTPLPVDPR